MVERYIKNSGSSPIKWVFIVIFTALFVTTLLFVFTGRLQEIDKTLFSIFIDMREDALTKVFRALTFCGDQATVIALCLLVVILPGRMKIGLPVALMTGTGAAVQSLIKNLVARPRLDMQYWLTGDTDWLGFSFGYSFPSGHANTSLIFWVALLILTGRVLILQDNPFAAALLRIILFAFAVLIGLSRIYLGVHYPSDVFGGWMLAGLLLLVFFTLYDNFWPSRWRVTYDAREWDAIPRDAEKKRRWRKPSKKRQPSELLKFPKNRSPWKF